MSIITISVKLIGFYQKGPPAEGCELQRWVAVTHV
jgi:hypothetical protein